MANQERVVLIAEVRDEATADLDKINKSVDETSRKIESAGKGTEKSTGRMTTAFDRFSKGGSTAFQRFSGSARKSIGDSTEALGSMGTRASESQSALGRFVNAGTKGLRNFRTGFKNLGAAQFESTGLMGTLGGMTQKFVRGLKGANTEGLGLAGTIGGAFNRIGTTISGLTSSAVSAGAAIVSSIGGALTTAAKRAGQVAGVLGGLVIGEGLRGGLSRAMNIEDAEARMRGMGYEVAEISELMDNASDAIMGTAFRLDDAATTAAQFSAAGVSAGEDMERVIGLVGDSAFAAGTDFNQMSEIWAQVAARGRLDGQTMNRLLSAGVGITSELADKFGVAEEEVQKLVSEGSVSFEDFAEVMETKVGGAAQQMAETTRGALMNVQAGLHMLGAEVAGPFMELFRGAMNRLQEPMFALAAVVEPVFGVLTERAQEWASGMYTAGEDAAEGINRFVEPMQEVADLMRDGEGMVSAFAEAFDLDTDSGLLGMLSAAVDLFQDLSPLTNIFSGIAESGSDAFGAIFDALQTVAPVIGQSFKRIGEAVGPLIVVLAEGFAGLVEAVGPSLIGMVNSLVGAFSLVLPVLTTIMDTVFTALADVLPMLMPVLSQIVSAVAHLLVEIGPLLGDVVGLIADAVVSLVPIITPIISVIAGLLVSLVPVVVTLVEALLPVLGVVIELGAALLTALLPVLAPLTDVIIAVVEAAAELLLALVPLIPPLLELAFMLIEPLIGLVVALAPILAVVLVGAINILVPIIVWLVEKVGELIEWFAELGMDSEWLGETITAVWQWIQDDVAATVEWFMEVAVPWLKDVWDSISRDLTWLWEEVLQPTFRWIRDTWTTLSETFSTMWNETIKPALTSFGEFVMTIWNEWISPALGWISDRFSDLGAGISRVWNETIKPALSALSDFVMDTVVPGIQAGVDTISSIWDTVTGVFQAPINWVLEHVWNKGIVAAFNKAADVVGFGSRLDTADLIGGGGTSAGGSSTSGRGGGAAFAAARAEGGPVSSGVPYLVGEEGPEIITPSRYGWVHTAAETQSMLGTDAHPPMGIGAPVTAGGTAAIAQWFATSDNSVAEFGRDAAGNVIQWARGKLADAATALLEQPLADMASAVSGDGLMGGLAEAFINHSFAEVMDWIRGEDNKAIASGEYDEVFTANPGGFNRPAQGVISSDAGRRSYPGAFGGMHYGVDIANSIGTAVRAAWSGVVKSVSGSGNDQRMVLNHGSYDTAYFHNSAHLVSPGDSVTGGQRIALMGSAGTGPHLHFEYHPGGWYNPSIAGVNALFDQGGVLPTGTTIAQNNTGLPEYVLTNQRFGQVEDALDYVSANLPMPSNAGGKAGAGYVDQRDYSTTLTIEPGGVTLAAGVDGRPTQEGLDWFKEWLEETLEESARRDY